MAGGGGDSAAHGARDLRLQGGQHARDNVGGGGGGGGGAAGVHHGGGAGGCSVDTGGLGIGHGTGPGPGDVAHGDHPVLHLPVLAVTLRPGRVGHRHQRSVGVNIVVASLHILTVSGLGVSHVGLGLVVRNLVGVLVVGVSRQLSIVLGLLLLCQAS